MSIILKVHEDALAEAFDAVCELLPVELQEEFIQIGGAAMIAWGGRRPTSDVEVAASLEAGYCFVEAVRAGLDGRFSLSVMGQQEERQRRLNHSQC